MKQLSIVLVIIAMAAPALAKSEYYVRNFEPEYYRNGYVVVKVKIGRRGRLDSGSVYGSQICAELTHGTIKCGSKGRKYDIGKRIKIDFGRIGSRSSIERMFIRED